MVAACSGNGGSGKLPNSPVRVEEMPRISYSSDMRTTPDQIFLTPNARISSKPCKLAFDARHPLARLAPMAI